MKTSDKILYKAISSKYENFLDRELVYFNYLDQYAFAIEESNKIIC